MNTMTIDDILSACKFYHGEEKNPYEVELSSEEMKDKALLWFWEHMFVKDASESMGYPYDTVKRWCDAAELYRTESAPEVEEEYRDNPFYRIMTNEDIPLIRRAIVEFVSLMRGKWFPYEDPSEIIKYYEQ
jgi:hypothetical protein